MDLLGFVALALAVFGLIGVIGEIAFKDPRAFLEMAEDSRRFATPVRRAVPSNDRSRVEQRRLAA